MGKTTFVYVKQDRYSLKQLYDILNSIAIRNGLQSTDYFYTDEEVEELKKRKDIEWIWLAWYLF